jgi:vitamin B12 transporter
VVRLGVVAPLLILSQIGAGLGVPLDLGPGTANAQEIVIPLDTLTVQVGSHVSPSLPALTRSVQLFDRTEIDALPVGTLSGLLEWATGVEIQSRSPAQSDLSIRGAGFEQVVVLVNGVRMSDPQTGHFDLDLAVPLDRVERVEILRGPASALYGADAVGGVVNVVTRDGGPLWQGRVAGGSWGTARLSVGGGVEKEGGFSVRGGGELSRSDGHRLGTDYDMALAHLAADHPVGQGTLSGEVGIAVRNFGAQDFYAPFPAFEKTRSYTGSLRWSSPRLDRTVQWDLGASYRRHLDDFVLKREDPSFYRNEHTSSQAAGEVLARVDLFPGAALAVGGEMARDLLESTNLGDRAELRGAVLGELVLGRDGPVALAVGLRNDWHEGFGSFLSPSVSGSYRLGSRLRVRGALGRSFRAPTWTERYYRDPVNVGREDLDPERAWSGEVGGDYFGGSGFRASVTLFERRATDLIDWARDVEAEETVPWETRNVEEATFQGIELDLTFFGPLQTRWSLGGTVMSADSEEALGFRSKYALRPLLQRYLLGFRKNWDERFSVGVNAQRGKRSAEEPFHRVDLRTGYRFGSVWVYLDANNLLDAEYSDVTGATAPGRAFGVGLELRSRLIPEG